ncbi:MAG: GNAT family N-acetyltransferase [Planctomycetota bacterium]
MIRDSGTQLSGECKIVVVKSFEEIESIREIWEKMQHDEPYPVPNADIDRYISIAKASGDDVQPYVMLLKYDGHPAAMSIGRIEKRRLDFKLGYKKLFSPALKCLSITYGGIIGRPSAELCEVLIDELMNVLRSGRADLIFFNHLRIDSPIYKLFKTVPVFFSRSHFALAEPHWQTIIPDTVEEFYRKIPNSRKRRWRRDIRQLEKISSSEIKIVCYRELSDINYLIEVACRIKESTYKSALAMGFVDSDVNRALLEKAAGDGSLRAYILYVGDEPCAFQFDFRYGKTQFTEFGSFDPKWSRGSPGTVLLIKVIEELCRESDVSIMDYGFGHALYKSKFGTHHWLEETVCIYAMRLRPVLINIAISANQACSVLLIRAAKRLNLDSWIKRKWRKMVSKNSPKGSTQEKGNVELLS